MLTQAEGSSAGMANPRHWAIIVKYPCKCGTGPWIGYPVHDQAIRVVESARRLCKVKMREPSVSPAVIHDLETGPLCIGADTFGAGRRHNSMTARRASKIPVLLYPPVFSFINGHTKSPREQWANGTTERTH